MCYSAVGVMRRGRDSKGDDRSRCPSALWRPKPRFLTGHSDVTGDVFVFPGDAFVPISYKNECFFFLMCKINFSWVSQSDVSFRPSKPPMAALKRFTLISVTLAYSGHIKRHLQWCSAELLAVASQPQTLTVCNKWTFVDHIWTRGWSARWSAITQAQIPAN